MRIDSEEVIVSRLWDNHGKEVGYEQKGVLVRCKDCKHRVDYLDGDGWYCDATNNCLMRDENFYCSYGERKDNE